VVPREDGLLFGPSRFIGYLNNSRAAHLANGDKDGKRTNPAISRTLHQGPVEDAHLEEAFRQFCEHFGVDYLDLEGKNIRRRYWLMPLS
jgi:hypothetical protein